MSDGLVRLAGEGQKRAKSQYQWPSSTGAAGDQLLPPVQFVSLCTESLPYPRAAFRSRSSFCRDNPAPSAVERLLRDVLPAFDRALAGTCVRFTRIRNNGISKLPSKQQLQGIEMLCVPVSCVARLQDRSLHFSAKLSACAPSYFFQPCSWRTPKGAGTLGWRCGEYVRGAGRDVGKCRYIRDQGTLSRYHHHSGQSSPNCDSLASAWPKRSYTHYCICGSK
jgi:hypothetical protein